MTNSSHASSATADLNQALRRPDLSILGLSITHLPASQWRERMLFMGVPDKDLRRHTEGRFPATLRPNMDTHPVFVLQCRATGHLLCPCTSKKNNKLRYIQKGCELEPGKHVQKRNTYLVEDCAFTIPLDNRFSRRLFYRGRVPSTCIREAGQ